MRRALLWVAVLCGAALVGLNLVFRAFWIPSGSMRPTLEVGDYVVANRAAYGFPVLSCGLGLCDVSGGLGVVHGDVAVFRHPAKKTHYVKRIVGLPGDRVAMIEGVLHLNGVAVGDHTSERLPGHPHYSILNRANGLRGDTMPEMTVPPFQAFALGDNRDNSNDSRFSIASGGIGMIPLSLMVGRVDIILFSLDGVEDRFMRWVE